MTEKCKMDSKKKQLETFNRTKHEEMNSFLRMFQDMNQKYVDEIRDTSLTFQSKFRLSGPDEFDRYPHSPTAQTFKLAFNSFLQGFACLKGYEKDAVESETDCDFLEPGFHGYAVGYILENVLVGFFLPPNNTTKLIDQYLRYRPNDFLTEYFKLRLYIREQSTQEKLMKNIIACEVLANKMESRELSDRDRMVLTDIYSVVASLYTVSKQNRRAVDSFEKALKLDETNSNATYGIAFNISFDKPERAESLLLKFLEITPPCDKKYPNALYYLSQFYMVQKSNVSKSSRYFEMAVDSEKNRLPFLSEVDLDAKTCMTQLMPFIRRKGYCNNPECSTNADSTELKKCTRCKSVYYCGRDCQRQDWSYHKKTCKSG